MPAPNVAYDFLCDACGYRESHIPDGPGENPLARRQAMTCHECRRLVDVVTRLVDPERLQGRWAAHARSAKPELERLLGRCPHCGGTNLTAWGRGSTKRRAWWGRLDAFGPCPRCGAPIRTVTNRYIVD